MLYTLLLNIVIFMNLTGFFSKRIRIKKMRLLWRHANIFFSKSFFFSLLYVVTGAKRPDLFFWQGNQQNGNQQTRQSVSQSPTHIVQKRTKQKKNKNTSSILLLEQQVCAQKKIVFFLFFSGKARGGERERERKTHIPPPSS